MVAAMSLVILQKAKCTAIQQLSPVISQLVANPKFRGLSTSPIVPTIDFLMKCLDGCIQRTVGQVQRNVRRNTPSGFRPVQEGIPVQRFRPDHGIQSHRSALDHLQLLESRWQCCLPHSEPPARSIYFDNLKKK